MRQRAAQINQRNAWKTQGTGAKFMSGSLLWGRKLADEASDIPIDITGVSRGCRPGELFYSLPALLFSSPYTLLTAAAGLLFTSIFIFLAASNISSMILDTSLPRAHSGCGSEGHGLPASDKVVTWSR